MDIDGDIWLIEINEEELANINKELRLFFEKNPEVDNFVKGSDSDVNYAIGLWAQSNFPQRYGPHLHIGYKHFNEDFKKEIKTYLEIRDSKHGFSPEAISQRGYSRRRVEFSNEIGDFKFATKKYGLIRHIPRGLYPVDISHTLLPDKIENTLPPLEKLLDRSKGELIEYSATEIKRGLGRDVLSYLIEKNKELFG